MLESEKSSLAGRVHDLERRVLTQQDEIVCLRSTLADVLRRVNLFEGIGSERQQQGQSLSGRTSSAPGTPARTNSISSSRASPTPQQQQPLGPTFSNSSSSYGSNSLSNTYNGNGEVIRLRKPQSRPVSSSSSPSGAKGNSIEAMLRRNTLGSSGALNSTRPRTSHHQSNGSLHSDQSSSSVSPAPSPSPRPPQSASALGKRWSSTGDFTHSPLTNR